jgi:hypothetical protein
VDTIQSHDVANKVPMRGEGFLKKLKDYGIS